MTSDTDHPDFATMRASLRELTDDADADSLACPNPTCEGTLRTTGGLLSCPRCIAAR